LNLGSVALEQGQFAQARAPFEEALTLARAAGNRQVELSAQIGLARLDLDTGEPARALHTLAQVAAQARNHGLHLLLGDVVGCSGEALLRQGRQAAAARCLAAAAAQRSADERARGRWSAALRSLPGGLPATPPQAFDECLDQIVAGRFG
jgi:tetratricopeptide (TPR) repeat protein